MGRHVSSYLLGGQREVQKEVFPETPILYPVKSLYLQDQAKQLRSSLQCLHTWPDTAADLLSLNLNLNNYFEYRQAP